MDPAASRMTVGRMADQWIASKVNLKPSTRALYDSILETHVRPRWATTQLARVTHEDIQVWVSALLAAGTGAAHVRKIVGTVLRGILALAVRSKRLPANPCDGIQLPRISHTAKRYLTAARVAALADAAAELPARRPRRGTDASFAQYRLATLTLAYCGLRWSELAALRTSRVDLLRRRILVAEAVVEVDGKQLVWGSPKNHEVRSIPVPRFLADELATHLMHKAPTDLVFTSPTGGVLRNRNARKAWFDRAAVAIGELGLTPHELRHTAASLAVSAGANVKAVQRILGHASATLTLDTYADLSDSDLDAVADRLDAAFRANSEPATASIRHLPPAGDLG